MALTKHGSPHQLVNCSTGAKTTATAVMEALRILKRRLSDVVYRAMLADQTAPLPGAAGQRSKSLIRGADGGAAH